MNVVLNRERLMAILERQPNRIEDYTDEQNHRFNLAQLNLTEIHFEIDSKIKTGFDLIAKNTFYIESLNKILTYLLGRNQTREIESNAFYKRDAVKKLHLENNKLFGIRRNTFRGLKSLCYLMMNSNRINRIHPNIFRLHFEDLSELDLSYNSIPFITLGSFSGLKNLDKLNLSNNRLVEIHPNAFLELENLKFLDLSENQLTELNSNIFQSLKLLTVLDLSGNGLVKIGWNLFKDLKNLEDLRLNSNRIAEIHSEAFKHLKHLKTLDLSENQLKYINRKLFEASSKLEYLNLSKNKIEEIDSNAFKKCKDLQVLSISHNRLTSFDIEFTSTRIQQLNISHNRIEKLNPMTFWAKMIDIKIIRFDHNQLTRLDWYLFETMPSLIFVSLFENPLNPNILSYYNEPLLNSNLSSLSFIDGNGINQIIQDYKDNLRLFCDNYLDFILKLDFDC